jgi:hypothetical protein
MKSSFLAIKLMGWVKPANITEYQERSGGLK